MTMTPEELARLRAEAEKSVRLLGDFWHIMRVRSGTNSVCSVNRHAGKVRAYIAALEARVAELGEASDKLKTALEAYLYEPHCATLDVGYGGLHKYHAGGFCPRCAEHYGQGQAALNFYRLLPPAPERKPGP